MTAVPTLLEIDEEPDSVRKAILGAMMRIAQGRPLRVPVEARSVVALATEAEVKRYYLTHKNSDLRDRYNYIAKHVLAAPAPVPDADERVEKLKLTVDQVSSRLDDVRAERDHWEQTAKLFIRAMNVQEVQLAERDLTIRRLQKQLDDLASGQDELAARRHRPPNPARN